MKRTGKRNWKSNVIEVGVIEVLRMFGKSLKIIFNKKTCTIASSKLQERCFEEGLK